MANAGAQQASQRALLTPRPGDLQEKHRLQKVRQGLSERFSDSPGDTHSTPRHTLVGNTEPHCMWWTGSSVTPRKASYTPKLDGGLSVDPSPSGEHFQNDYWVFT